jgi:hypothetical protein
MLQNANMQRENSWSASVMLKMPNSNKLLLKEMQTKWGNADINSKKISNCKMQTFKEET